MDDRREIDALRADRRRLEFALREAGARFTGSKVGCPFHDDQSPSAGIYEADGSWFFRCHGCGAKGDVIDVTRRVHGCDFPAALERLGLGNGHLNGSASSNGRVKPVATRPQNRAIERNGEELTGDTPRDESEAPSPPGRTFASVEAYAATLGDQYGGDWHYQAPDGSPFLAVVRENKPDGGKRFMPLHPTPDGWAIGDPPGKLPLYALPHLAGADCVYVVEGEKCADAARSIGLVATTSAHGSGSAEKSDWTPLAGKRVVILPDNDEAGRKYAATVKGILSALNPPATARIVELPGLAPKGDIADYIDARDSVDPDEIRRGIEGLFDPFAGTSIGDLWRNPRTWAPVTYIPTGLRWLDARLCGGFRTRGASVIAGKTGQGKTQFSTACAVNAAKAGFPTAILSLELTASTVAKLIACQLGEIPRSALDKGKLHGEYGAKLGDVQERFSILPLSILDYSQWPGGLTREACASIVGDGVKRFGWKLVVLDYLGLLVPSEIDRDQYDTDVRHSTELKRLADVHDVAFVAIAATRKGAEKRTIDNLTSDDVLGAGRLCYDAQLVMGVGCQHGEENCGLIKVRLFKHRFGPCSESDPPVQLRWRSQWGAIVDLDVTELDGGYDPDDQNDGVPF